MARIDDGFPTLVSLGDGVVLWEKSVTPPAIEGGGENDTTTMRNTAWRTRAPKKLRTLTEMSFTAAYDPAVYDEILDNINNNQEITVTFPDDSTLTFWGWLDAFTPNEITEGEQPDATVTIIASNQDNAGVEQAPVYEAPPSS